MASMENEKRFKHLQEVRPDVSNKLTNKETDI